MNCPKSAIFRSLSSFLLFLGVVGWVAGASAQLALPQKSPHAMVMQQIGVTDVEVDYSSPAARGRKLWGEVVEYGTLWRTGANAATRLRFSRDVMIAGNPIPAGKYALYTLPGPKTWTVILNKGVLNWGTRGYDMANDVARFEVSPVRVKERRERMRFVFLNTTQKDATLALEWGRLRVPILIQTRTEDLTLEAIHAFSEQRWRAPADAARYLLGKGVELDTALRLTAASLALKETWFGHWVRAQVLHKSGDQPAALAAARAALKLGLRARSFSYRAEIERAIAEWSR